MDKPDRERAVFASEAAMELGSRHEDVSRLQHVLERFGYLQRRYEHGTFCRRTRRAVRRFQKFYGLSVDGVVGPETRKLFEQPRCGVPDIPPSPSLFAPFVLRGCKYDKRVLTYAFENGTSDLKGDREREIVAQAFGDWAAVTDLRFKEVAPSESPDFRIAWRVGDHGDGASFDGPGRTLAHAFFPPPCGGSHAGAMHFDDGERWSDDPGDEGILLGPVTIHEIGHLLGLGHSRDPEAIMFALYSPERTKLSDDDIRGVRELYGTPAGGERNEACPRCELA